MSETGIHVDFDGTSLASKFGINVPLSYTTAYTVFGLGCVVASQIPNNAGSLLPLTVAASAGSILNAPKPAPVASRHVIGQMLPDVVFGCRRQLRILHGGDEQRRHRRALCQGWAFRDGLSQRGAWHAGRDCGDADAVDLLAQGAASG